MLPKQVAFGTPRKLPKASQLTGRVVVLDIAFAGAGKKVGFEQITLPLISGLGDRLAAWVDHHDHEAHSRYVDDPRFHLATKAQHGACPEMITPELVTSVGEIETIVCHTDFDGLASAAKWMLDGWEPYPGCDADAHAVDTRLGKPSAIGKLFDRALRARPRDNSLLIAIVQHLYGRLKDPGLAKVVEEAAAELLPIEKETRRAASKYVRLGTKVMLVDIRQGFSRVDKTLLMLMGQERAPVSIVIDSNNVAVAAGFESGYNFVQMLGLAGGMPTRVSVPHGRLRKLLSQLEVPESDLQVWCD